MHISCRGEQLGPGAALPFAPSQWPAGQGCTSSHWAGLTHPAAGLGCSRPSASALLHNHCYEENPITGVICKQECTSARWRNANCNGQRFLAGLE